MHKNIYEYFQKEHKELYSLGEDIDNLVFTSPHSVILKARVYIELLSKEIAKLEKMEELNSLSLAERLSQLRSADILNNEINGYFFQIRINANKVAHEAIEGELQIALSVHRYIYKITCWFIETYLDYNFHAPLYKDPTIKASNNDNDDQKEHLLAKLIGKVDSLLKSNEEKTKENINQEKSIEDNNEKLNHEEKIDTQTREVNIKVPKEKNKECLIQQLSKLKQSSREAVEGLNEFSSFKTYMHVPRNVQNDLEELIKKANDSSKAQLILVCGSVGDGKSHIISYFKNKYPEIMSNFILHNDATESLEPEKTSMDTLNDVLDQFSDEKIETSNEKFILAINLGTLNNFIDSEYRERYTKLRQYVIDKNILESTIEDNHYDENSNIQFVNFSDYHLFNLKDGKVKSDYIKSLINKVTDASENNIFYNSYKENCLECKNCTCCPIKANYELISKEEVQDGIVDLLVQCIIKNKIIISTRALLNFIYEMIISRTYVDVNSPTFKNKIAKLNNIEYINALTPNIIFNHKELSFIFESLNRLDPLNVRNSRVDDFILEFNNSTDIMKYFKEYIDFPKNYLKKVDNMDFNSTRDSKIRSELLKLFIRSYYLCGHGDLFTLKDKTYEEYIENVYYWNKGDKSKLKKLYSDIKEAIMKWNGEADKSHINIFLGKNQIKYKVSEEIELKADVSNLPKNQDIELKKFLTTIKLSYKKDGMKESYDIDLDFALYDLLQKVVSGYRPNKKDKNHFIKFIEFINKIEEIGSKDEKLIFIEKNKEENKKYKLEYNDEFEEYRFVEM